MFRALIISSLVLNVGILLGRLSGFAREAFVASTFGVTAEADVVVLMLTIPDVLVNILMGGAMGAALIPVFTEKTDQARQLLYQMMLLGLVFFALVCVLALWFMPQLIGLLAPGLSSFSFAQAVDVVSGVIWLIPLTVMAGMTTAYLQANNQFAVPAVGTLIINGVIIAGLLTIYYGYGSLDLLVWFILGGGLLRLVSQLIRVKVIWNPLSAMQPYRVNKGLLLRYGQAMLAGSTLLLIPVAARAMASYSGDGGIAVFNYASKLIEFPLVIAVTFLSAVLFPRLASSYQSDRQMHMRLVKIGLQLSLGLSITAVIFLSGLHHDYISFVFGYGVMTQTDLNNINSLLSIGLFSLPVLGVSSMLTAGFNARQQPFIPMVINTLGLGFFIALVWTLDIAHSLTALMWALVGSYTLICAGHIMAFRLSDFSWADMLAGRVFISFFIPLMLVTGISVYIISGLDLSSWLRLFIAALLVFSFMILMVFRNAEIRALIKPEGSKA
ncbi:MAG: hypothetical protein GXP22_07370 [Gammaproteobacteria bacterium]|nr:hypothetical protein [Gammaproteobacteria bacterium]